MKKRIFIILSLIIAFVIIFTINLNSESHIENQKWKYSEGTHIGDWLDKNNFEIRDGIIYSNNEKAKIVFSIGRTLIIKNLETNEKGFYVNKS